MRLCCNCFEELLDRETICPICSSDRTLDNNQTKEFYYLVKEIRTAGKLKQKFLKKDPKYELAFKYIAYREEHPKNNNYNRPKILDISSQKNINESEEEYWDRINQHTLNKPNVNESIPKCPICGSTNIKKITIRNRAVKTAVFGVVGAIDDAGKTYKCENCGSKF